MPSPPMPDAGTPTAPGLPLVIIGGHARAQAAFAEQTAIPASRR